jgi:methyl-accepting chemotaxis protein
MNRAPTRDARGHAANAAVLAVVLVALLTTATLLARTMRATDRINAKAAAIARTGQGINTATDSIVQLRRTNETASSILESTKPLQGELAGMVDVAEAVDGLSGSIDGHTSAINATVAQLLATAGRISSTAGDVDATTRKVAATGDALNDSAKRIGATTARINDTTKGINSAVAALLDVARRIDHDVALVNQKVQNGIELDQALKADTGNLIVEVAQAQHTAACIDRKVVGTGADNHC